MAAIFEVFGMTRPGIEPRTYHIQGEHATIRPLMQTTQCGPGNWILYNNTCYLMSPTYGANSSLSWYQAQQYCITNGANLASIHSRDENNLLLSMVSKLNRNEFWIGLNELQKPGKYKWTDGTVLDFISWNGNEPNDAFGGERCGGILSFNGNWNDDNCNEALGFICKKVIGSAGPVTPQVPQLVSGGCAVAGFSPDPYGNKCFFASNTTNPMDWKSALMYCRNFGTGYDIAAINNEMEQAFTASLIQGFYSDVWIGLNNVRHHSRFVWQDNSPFLYTNWNTGEPNGRSQQGGKSTEDCVEMYTKGIQTGSWNDLRCNIPRNVICQGPKVQGKQTPSPQGNCKQGYVSHGTSCYLFVKTPGQNWQMANNLCGRDGGTLVTINSNAENYFVESQMGPNFDYWIGLQYNMYSRTFSWRQSWPVLFTRWVSGEPSTGPNDMCVKMSNGNWDNTQCTLALGYVCEINSVQPPPATPAPLGHCRNSDEVINGDFCYYFSAFTYLSWPMARFSCNKRQMDLTSITTDVERQWIWNVMLNIRDTNGQRTAQNIWIGLTKGLNSGFTWSDNTAFGYNNWNQGEPSDPLNATKEECVEMYRDTSKWNDIICTQSKSFVCKGRAVLGAASSTSATQAPTQGPPTQSPKNPTVPPNPTLRPVNPITTKKPITPSFTLHPRTIPILPPINTVPQVTRRVVTVPRPNGALYGPNAPQISTRVVKNKNGLSGGALVGVLITVVAVLGILGMTGILYWKKRNPSSPSGAGASGFDNALYSKGNERVNINNTDTDA